MQATYRTLGTILIALILTMCGSAKSYAIVETSCRSVLAENSSTKYSSASSKEITLSDGTLVIIGGLDSIVTHTAIGDVEIPPGFAVAIKQSKAQERITVIGYRTKLYDSPTSVQAVTVTTCDDNVYHLQPSQCLTTSFTNNESTDVAITKIDPGYHEKLRIAASQLSLADLKSQLNGYELRKANEWAKSLLSLLGDNSTTDQPAIQITVGEQFVTI